MWPTDNYPLCEMVYFMNHFIEVMGFAQTSLYVYALQAKLWCPTNQHSAPPSVRQWNVRNTNHGRYAHVQPLCLPDRHKIIIRDWTILIIKVKNLFCLWRSGWLSSSTVFCQALLNEYCIALYCIVWFFAVKQLLTHSMWQQQVSLSVWPHTIISKKLNNSFRGEDDGLLGRSSCRSRVASAASATDHRRTNLRATLNLYRQNSILWYMGVSFDK